MVGRHDVTIFWQSWQMWAIAWLVRMASMAMTWVLLGRLLDSQEILYFLLVGNALIVGAQAAGWAAAAATWDRMDGTYPLLVAAPTSLAPVLIGRTLVWFLNAVASSLVTFVVLIAVFRMPLPVSALLVLPIAVVIACASCYGLAFFIGSCIIRMYRLRNILANAASIALMAFCGVSVPIVFWPEWVGAVAQVLPITHGLHAIRLLFADGAWLDIARGLALEGVVGTAWLGAGILTMDRMAGAGRRDGTIDFA